MINILHNKKMFYFQSFVLFSGTIFAWSQLIPQITNFYSTYGTLLKFRDCTVPNPFITACFFGSFAFLVALFWSFRVLKNPTLAGQRIFRNFLLFCVAFAGSVLIYEFADFYKLIPAGGGIPISCSPGIAPWKTPCFFGLLFFLSAYIASILGLRQLKLSLTSHKKED
jgi:hypothetical protein